MKEKWMHWVLVGIEVCMQCYHVNVNRPQAAGEAARVRSRQL
jgi:hypothetical protein